MVDQKLTDTLAELVRQNALERRPNTQQVSGLSQAILSSAGLQKPYDSKSTVQKKEKPSFVNRILDVMSRPLYGTLNAVKGNMERAKADGGDISDMAYQSARSLSPITNPAMLGDLWRGLSGKDKTTGRDILKETGVDAVLPGPAKFGAGLALDIAADPLTYVGGIGIVPKVGKAARGSTEALHALEEGTQRTSQSIADSLSARAARLANDPDVIAQGGSQGAGKTNLLDENFGYGPISPNDTKNLILGPNKVVKASPKPRQAALAPVEPTLTYEEKIAKFVERQKGLSSSTDSLDDVYGSPSKILPRSSKMDESPDFEFDDYVKPPATNTIKPPEVKQPTPQSVADEVDDSFFFDDGPESALSYAKAPTKQTAWVETKAPKLTKLESALGSAGTKVPEIEKAVSKIDEALGKGTKLNNIQRLQELNTQLSKTKSPVMQNVIRKEIEKLSAGINPADILTAAKTAPPPFPALTLNERWHTAAKATAFNYMKKAKGKQLGPVQQSNLYNSIVNAASKVRKDRRAFTVFQMLRVAEDDLLAAGKKLVDSEGISVRLSDVANISGGPRSLNSRLVDDFRKGMPSQAIEDLKTFTTPQVASEILDPVVKTAADLKPALDELPPARAVAQSSELSKALTKIAGDAGASSREAKTAKAFIDELFAPDRDKLYTAVEAAARHLVRQSATGIIDSKNLQNISKEVYKALGANPKVLGRELNQSKVTEGIMTKFATWWGAKDLKPFSREYIDTARNVASAFAEAITPIVRKTTPTQRAKAWTVATGKMSPADAAEEALANQFKYMAERLMGAHGISKNAEAVVLRSASTFKELNDELPKALKLIDTKGTDKIGRKFDYTGGNWMHSWKEWEGEPAEILYQLTRSLQMVTRKNSMWDDAAARWGMPIKGAEFQHTVKSVPRLAGTYFPKQIAEQIDNLKNQLDRDVFKAPHKAIQIFDQVQRMWKTGVTIYSPSHHIRNLNGDIYLAALDGVVSPRPYAIASKVLHAYPTRYKDLESVFNIMDPKLRDSALRARPGNVVLTTKRGEKVTAEQLYQAAESQGLFIRAMHIEDLVGDKAPAFGTIGPKFQPFGGKVYGAATRVSELRDHWVRLAHFADIIGKSKQPLRVAIEQAGRRVKKFHPDGMDLTGFEQNVLRRVVPFYSWMRKATPLVIEGALMRPQITMAFPKVMANAQLMTGIESEGPGDPFPMDQMFPEWLREKGVGPVLQPGSGIGRDANWRGEAPGYTIINPTNPFTDQLQQIGAPDKTLLSSLTPGARIPMELLMGQTSLGIPLENVEGGVPGYAAQQIPAVGIGARLTGMTRDNEPWNPEQLVNFLTAAGITGTGSYPSQAQAELKQRLAQMAKDNRGDYR